MTAVALPPPFFAPVAVPPPPAEAAPPLIEIRDFSFFYKDKQALHGVSMEIPRRRVTAFIGPSGCGKTTLLRSINRLNELIPHTRHAGDITVGGRSLFDPGLKLLNIRRCIGMVFQKSNPFPRSIYENVAFAVRVSGERDRDGLDGIVEQSLRQAALWDEVKDRLHESALSLSGGQMQRLCIARAIARRPHILLMDEPCSALDPVAIGRIEELIRDLQREFTIVIVTHSLHQAARLSDHVGFFHLGRLVEFGPTQQTFLSPTQKQTKDYLNGRFG